MDVKNKLYFKLKMGDRKSYKHYLIFSLSKIGYYVCCEILRKNSYLISFSLKKGIRYSHPICIVSYGENDINKWEVLEFYVRRINQARTKFINCITPTKYVFMHLRISCIQITFTSLVYPYHFCSVESLPNKNLRKQTYVTIRNLVSLFIFSCIVAVLSLIHI